MTSIASRGVVLMAALARSGRRSSKSFATSATSTVLVTAVVMAVIVMTTGVVTATATIATTTETTIGGDEFHSLGTNPHLTSAGILPVYPAKGLGSRRRGLYLFLHSSSYLVNSVNPVILSKTEVVRDRITGLQDVQDSLNFNNPPLH